MTTNDMLQVLIKGQEELRKGLDELRGGHDTLAQGLDELREGQDVFREELAILREEMRAGFRGIHERLDKQGKQLAYLDDDAPTREEHEGLVKRVEKIEKALSS